MTKNNDREYTWDDEDDDDDVQVSYQSESDLIKQMRKQLKQEQRLRKEAESKVNELSASQKERIIKDVLSSRGVNPKIAKFIPADIETSEDAINLWLESNSDVFGYEVKKESPISQDDVRNLQRMNETTTGAESPSLPQDLEALIMNDDESSAEEFLAKIRGF